MSSNLFFEILQNNRFKLQTIYVDNYFLRFIFFANYLSLY